MEDNYFGALYYYDFNPKVGSGQWNWSEFLISNGWPGKSVSVTFVPVKRAKSYSQAIFMNDGSHPKTFDAYREKGYNDDKIFFIVMAARWISEDALTSAKMYGYEHLKK